LVMSMSASVSLLTDNVNTLASTGGSLDVMKLTSLRDRTRYARNRADLTQLEAAAAIGCARATIANWESDQTTGISGEYLLPAAKVYRVRPEWLSMETDDDGWPWGPKNQRVRVHAYEIRGVDGEDGTDPATDNMVMVYDIEVSGGPGVIIPEFVETKYRLPFQIEWLRKWDAKPEDIRVALVRGDSMEPNLFDGDKVVFHMRRKRVINNATFVLVYGGEGRVKRLFTRPDGSLRIVSNNPDKSRYPDEIVQPDDMDQVLILGQVIDRSGAGGLGV
jgi:phage repressor protein C with HTH and peptisase S24 domain